MNEDMRLKAVEALRELLDDNHDSLTISTPAKGGEIKCYMNYSHPEECRKKLDNAFDVRAYAQNKIDKNGVTP